MIEYEYTGKGNPVIVKLDGKKVGAIKKYKRGFAYKPKGSTLVGEFFDNIIDVQKSLEEL